MMSYSSIAGRLNAAADGRRAAAIVILCVMLLAIGNAFVTDDAFISFRYARNLVEAGELTWNPGTGERVEGYTNFLWTLMIAGAIAAKADPVVASKILGLLFALATLVVTYRLSARLLQSGRWALLAVALLGTNYTFSAFATSGLETQMQTFLIVASAAMALSASRHERPGIGRAAALSILCAAALLTRLDSAIPIFALIAYAFMRSIRSAAGRGRRAAAGAALLLPALLIMGSWILWKRAYYGSYLPNPYYAKGTMFTLDIVKGGVLYIFEFFRLYGLLPLVFVGLLMFKNVLIRHEMRLLVGICALWFVYLVKVGGDFMEFRFIVPVIPFVFVAAAATLRAVRSRRIQAALAAMAAICSLFHATTFLGLPGVESIPKLKDYIVGESGHWELAGRVLGDLFPEKDVTVATTAAGAIPYYSNLPTIDMLGITDAWVARNGAVIGARPGHQRAATLAYLNERGVNIVIGHPVVESAGSEPRSGGYSAAELGGMFMLQNVEGAGLPLEARILRIPLDERTVLTVLYLNRNARVDAVIREKNIMTLPIARS